MIEKFRACINDYLDANTSDNKFLYLEDVLKFYESKMIPSGIFTEEGYSEIKNAIISEEYAKVLSEFNDIFTYIAFNRIDLREYKRLILDNSALHDKYMSSISNNDSVLKYTKLNVVDKQPYIILLYLIRILCKRTK